MIYFLISKKGKTHKIKGNRYEKKYIIIKNIEELRVSENKVTVMESEGDNEKFKLSREEGFMIENTDNIKRDICDARKKEIVLFYCIFVY